MVSMFLVMGSLDKGTIFCALREKVYICEKVEKERRI